MSEMPSARDLRPLGPLTLLDRAVLLVRRDPMGVALPAWFGGSLFAAAGLFGFYVERVEGITAARLGLAFLLVLGWWARAYWTGRASAAAVRAMWEEPPAPGVGRPLDVLRTSMVVALGLWIWSWMLVLGSLAGPLGVVLLLPVLCLRGAVGPSWLARSACEAEAGVRGFFRATSDSSGRRATGVGTELLMLLGGLGLSANLFGLAMIVLLLMRSFGGLDVSVLDSFFSMRNTFLLLVLGSVALVLLEPLRAAVSASIYVDARVRAEGLDLRMAIDDAVARASGPARDVARAAIVVLVLAGVAEVARAQEPWTPPAPDESADVSAPVELDTHDTQVQADVDAILARGEFREFEDERGAGLARLFERLIEWLLNRDIDPPEHAQMAVPSVAVPGAMFFLVVGGILLAAVIAFLVITRQRARTQTEAIGQSAAKSADPRDRAPSSFLDEAGLLAQEGRFREALRALYLATLVALDRRRVIAFDPHLTNWQYLRQMPEGDERASFRSFTRLFDHKWYGVEETSKLDYEHCRSLATQIVGGAEPA